MSAAAGPGFSIDLGGGEPLEVGGWKMIDGQFDNNQDSTLQQQIDHASLYRQCFSSSAGRYVLDDLIDMFFKQDIVEAGDAPGSQAPGIRQGQAHVVKRIFSMIEFANTGGGKPASGTISQE